MRFKGIFDASFASGSACTAVSADYPVVSDDEVLFCSGSLTVTLAAAGNRFLTRVINTGSGSVTVKAASGDTIEGAGQIVMPDTYGVVTLQGDGAHTHYRV